MFKGLFSQFNAVGLAFSRLLSYVWPLEDTIITINAPIAPAGITE